MADTSSARRRSAAEAGTEPTAVEHNAARLAAERAAVDRELEEIELLLRQARAEVERHEARRKTADERFSGLIAKAGSPAALQEAHAQLMQQTRRAALMTGQLEVLEGKQKVLRRYADGLRVALLALAGQEVAPPAAAAAQATDRAATAPREVLAAQEDLRRAIARQMHDGPAQSIANIALQAQVAQRLLTRDPAAASTELDSLRQIVQHALEATKNFIFDVRPMVLDDLGLVPTLRRAAREREGRAAIRVRFESVGADRRFEPELESTLFRIVDDALAGYLAAGPAEVLIRLSWTDEQVSASVAAVPRAEAPAAAEPAAAKPRRGGAEMPAALAGMIADQAADVAARAAARRRAFSLPETVWHELEGRARSVAIALSQSEDGLRVEATADIPSA